MKTNFLCRKVTYSLFFATIFLVVGLIPSFAQVQVEIQADQLIEQGTPLGQDVDSSLPLPFMYGNNNWRGFHSQLTLDNDPNTGIMVGEWGISIPDLVHFQYGIRGMQTVFDGGGRTKDVAFSKRYSVRYFYDKRNNNGTLEYKYHRKLYYNNGHVDLEMGDEIHILYNENSQKYMLYHVRGDEMRLLECETFKILETPDSYVSKYGRYSDDASNPATITHIAESVFEHVISSWVAGNLYDFWWPVLENLGDSNTVCEASPCANYYDDTFSPDPSCGLSPQRPFCFQLPKESAISELANISVYPNPTSGMTTIGIDSPTDEIITIKIIDLAGKVVREQEWNVTTGSNLIQIDMTSAPAGVYHVELDSEYRFESQKIIIIK